MSADNWTYCPKCQPKGDLQDDELYGEDYALREDYEQGVDRDGEYAVYYSCSCRQCGFAWKYKYKQKIT